MSITDILREQSHWTWMIMQESAHLGEMIREDAITSVNLATIRLKAIREGLNDFHITSFQGAHLEQEFGADWLWGVGQSRYLVQAKRLDVIKLDEVRGAAGISYTINIPQMDLLVAASQRLSETGQVDSIPAYVFYNSMTKLFGEPKPEEMGCVFINAIVLQTHIHSIKAVKEGQGSISISPADLRTLPVAPWFRMFGGQTSVGANQPVIPPTDPFSPTSPSGFPGFR